MDKLIGVLDAAEVGAVMLWDGTTGLLRPAAVFGYDQDIFKKIGLRAGEGITGKVFAEIKAQLLGAPDEIAEAMSDIRPENTQFLEQSLGVETLPLCTLAAPIAVDSERFGVLLLETIEFEEAK